MNLRQPLLFILLLLAPFARGDDAAPVRFSIENMDLGVDPGADFYHYATGWWIKHTPIPADQSMWISFSMVDRRNWHLLHDIMEHASTNKHTRTNITERLVGDFYLSAMNTNRLEKLKFEPIETDLRRIKAIGSLDELIRVLARLKISHDSGGSFFGPGVDVDERNTALYTLTLSQGGLGLPEREYYLSDSFAKERDAYVKYITDLETLAGEKNDKAVANAKKILEFETALAKASRTSVELRDPVANYNKMKTSEAAEKYPGLKLGSFLKESGRPDLQEIVVRQPNFFAALEKEMRDRPLEDLKTYFQWHVLNAAAPYLHAAAEKESFNFNGTTLGGATEQEPRWQRSGRVIDSKIGEALGKMFVEKYFPPEAKKRMNELVDNLRAVFKTRLEKVDWMTDPTRQKALAKFARFTPKIGYPDKFRDYSSVKIKPDDYLGNVWQAGEFESRRNWARIGKPVDRSEWITTPPTVNAYFNPPQNEIVFPAGILQPPFFDAEADDAINYGAIGFVIGHEITHGFDDQGRQYDADGNLKDWWAEADAKEFTKRADRIVKQFDQYEALPGIKVNGKLTLGENIADLGGLSIAYEAMERALAKDPSKRKMIDGFTPEQRFFLSAAQVWRWNIREPLYKQLLTTDGHAPAPFRVMGPMSNLPEFYEAFQIKPTAKIWRAPDQRAKIW